MTAPRTASPVLLGPIDRIGGHTSLPRAVPAIADNAVTVETQAGFDLYLSGPYIMVSRYDSGARPATITLGKAMVGKDDRDVRITSLQTGGWAMNSFGITSWHNDAELHAVTVKTYR